MWAVLFTPETRRAQRKRRDLSVLSLRILRVLCVSAVSLTALLFATVLITNAQEPTQDDVNRVANQLYCPVCENITLANCPTQACIQWRARIRDELAAGKSDEEIIQGFVRDYGMRVVGEPPIPLLWWLPPLGLAAAAVFLVWLLRSWAKRPRPATVEAEPIPLPEDADEYRARLERELREEV